jgi:pimeloyl-ACP methyl ester carboxylesterase
MQKGLAIVLIASLGAYGLACLALFVFQRSLIYYPPPRPAVAAPRTSLLAVPGAVLKVSERPLAGPKALIYFGGNAEDVSASLSQLDAAFPGRALYLLHYRGYAGSSGSPTEAHLIADALALFDRVAREHADIAVMGRSLGSGVAVQLASRRPVSRLVLVTPYASIAGIAASRFRWFPVRWLLKDTFESARHAPRIRVPTLILAAGRDEVIPAWSTRQLLSSFAPGVASMVVIDEAGHNTISAYPTYTAALQSSR